MADKSPRNTMSKKAGKSIKEKRAEKKSGATAASSVEKLIPPNKR